VILSDATIKYSLRNGDIVIDPPPQEWQIQPASIDLTLAADFFSPYQNEPVHYPGAYTILPGECVLGTTVERVELSSGIVGRVEGKSSWGRRFLMIHSTAGFIDPGFKGTITLELVNLSKVSQILPVGSPIAQISFQYTDRPVIRPYGSEGLNSHYQGQNGVTPSAIAWH
jgi:dCTP deaminase